MQEQQQEKFHWGMQALSGARISKDEAGQLEERLALNSLDYSARATLLGYYSSGQAKSKVAILNRIKHILWVIEHVPECDLGKTPYLHISKSEHLEHYLKEKELLLMQCERFKTNAVVLADLACVFSHEEPEVALQFLREAHSIAGQEQRHRIAFWLSRDLHRLGRLNNDRASLAQAVAFMQEVVAARTPDRRFDYRFWLANMAFDSEQFDLAEQVCREMLADNSENSQAAHVAHIVLGSIALNSRDIPSAVEHLLLAGRVHRSPRLCSYGPMMKLAQNLLVEGQRDQVIQYLTDCKKFWDMGKRKLPKWIREIKEGKSPILQGDDF